MKIYKFLITILVISFFNVSSKAVTLNAIMENVPDTLFIQELLPDFKAKTGIDVEFEIMGYGEMHPKMVPSLSNPVVFQGSSSLNSPSNFIPSGKVRIS